MLFFYHKKLFHQDGKDIDEAKLLTNTGIEHVSDSFDAL
jgi:hypothetical protein